MCVGISMHCSSCGATIENGYKFCKSCGVALADNTTPSHTNVIAESSSVKSKKQESTSNGNVVGFLTISGLFIAIIGTLVSKFHMSINPVFGVFFVIFFIIVAIISWINFFKK